MKCVPIEIPCAVENYGIITRCDAILSPGAVLLLRHVREVAEEIFELQPSASTTEPFPRF